MKHTTLNRSIALVLFCCSMLVYLLTMAPTLSFWDCGEFIATATTLGIPHPPGAPLFLLTGRVFSMVPLFGDIAARVNLLSVLASAATVTVAYLVTVRLMVMYRASDPDHWTVVEKIASYGGAAVGALALAFSDSFWFNAVETEVYAASTLFTALVFWFVLRWYAEPSEAEGQRWLLAAMYLIGLSIGVHLLSLLAVFAVVMLYYYRNYTVTLRSFLLMMLAASAVFIVIYSGVIKGVPFLLQRFSWWGAAVLLSGMVYAVYHAHIRRHLLLHTVSMSLLLLVIGYTSYATIFVRAQASPPINENNPSTAESFFSYLNREQYGDLPLWPRRWSSDPLHRYFYGMYESEADYFLRYQLGHMYLRYFGWQFIGREHHVAGSPVDWSQLWGLPFLLGMIGAVYHWRRQWKLGSVVTALFLLTGAALVIYLNQTEPQPRERDYSYVGSFFAFALWIGIGAEVVLMKVSRLFSSASLQRQAAVGAAAVLLLLVDGRMLASNYHTHDRSGNYVPWDWAWNILQSCGPDALLFTNGDNDTFPLWYLQEVEGIRTDVRVINLSLANTGWYLLQLKNTSPRGAAKVRFSLSDRELKEISYVPVDPFEVSVPAGGAADLLEKDSPGAAARFPGSVSDTLSWTLRPTVTFRGQGFLRPQDVAVYDIVMNNFADRPICFALTVGQDNLLGLDPFLQLEGLVYRLVPVRVAGEEGEPHVDLSRLASLLFEMYRYRNLADPDVFLDETARRLSSNYKPLFTRLALGAAESGSENIDVRSPDGSVRSWPSRELALHALDMSEQRLPLERFSLDPEFVASVVYLYTRLDEKQKADHYISYLEQLASVTTVRDNPRLFYALALSLREVGRTDEAGQILEQMELPQ
ncbi:DUF2723 domain-containing protein [Prosthecochloris sp. N3]|uniref:DUF2723 domain-containing protein n=1 Tax=Prosthecochloris ethylica TaxID=2743976 RepID=A0ABR9XNX4_9CHLB|nr:DUF2723 domain-containing protein [Prosthecochloris ethylica]MBF0585824.1 DUF2723 domain-containing protein [Prosthecochloris ethylica]MBF0635734.1 DUF2723 domain-containing protein [Prosthecochloris ethylica]NUK47032.1 DUF2723 domain-containing protein [Prosthecochloris ethylica]